MPANIHCVSVVSRASYGVTTCANSACRTAARTMLDFFFLLLEYSRIQNNYFIAWLLKILYTA